MPELVADSTDTGTSARVIDQLVGAGIAQNRLAVEHRQILGQNIARIIGFYIVFRLVRIAVIQSRLHIPGMWPNTGSSTAIGLAITCIEDIHQVHIAIAILIIVGKIHTHILRPFAGIYHKVCHIPIIALVSGIRAIVGSSLRQNNRTYYIKLRAVQAIRLVLVVLLARTYSTVVGIFIRIRQ